MEVVRTHIAPFFQPPYHRTGPLSLSEAGANVPPELFARILHFVSRDNHRQEVSNRMWKELRTSRKPRTLEWDLLLDEEIMKASSTYKLKTCSLVCRYWANQSRKYMFEHANMTLRSYEDIILFRKYATQGSPGLVRICDLIKTLDVTQSYSWPRSVADLICLPSTQDKLETLRIELGDSPSLPLSKMDTPHWSLANPAVMPLTTTSYKRMHMDGITFPSFIHLAKYLTHFADTRALGLWSLIWRGKHTQPVPSQFVKSAIRRRYNVGISATGCTDNLLVCLQAAMTHPDCILRILPNRDQYWAMGVMRHICNFYDMVPDYSNEGYGTKSTVYRLETSKHHLYPQHIVSFGVYSSHPEYPRLAVYLACDSKPLTPGSTRRGAPPNAERISGVTFLVDVPNNDHPRASREFKFSTADLMVLRSTAENRCALRVVLFAFRNYAMLLAFSQQYSSLREPIQPPNQQTYLFVCARSEQNPFPELPGWNGHDISWVAIDPITLQTSGEQWQHSISDVAATLLRRI